jgi:hypothetical protein
MSRVVATRDLVELVILKDARRPRPRIWMENGALLATRLEVCCDCNGLETVDPDFENPCDMMPYVWMSGPALLTRT